MRNTSWSTALLAMLLSLPASSALGSDATSGSSAVRKADVGQVSAEVGRLGERVEDLEKRVDRRDASYPAPAPTAASAKRARQEQDSQMEFLQQVWSAP